MKQRLLVTISFSFSVRYFLRTGLLHKLRDFITPVIALTWNEPELIDELRQEGFEVHVVPASFMDDEYKNIRRRIDYWFDAYALTGDSKKVQQKYLSQYIPVAVRVRKKLREQYNNVKLIIPAYRRRLFDTERKMLDSNTNLDEMLALVDRLQIDGVFTATPFHAQEDILLRACKLRKKRMIASILSFDNITKRGWIPVGYDLYLVWNKYNFEEMLTIYPNCANARNVVVTGAPQFDFYADKQYLMPEHEWRRRTGLPAGNQKVILYAGGPRRLFPNEPQYLKHIVEAIDANKIEGNPVVLFRCHPVDDINRWKQAIGDHSNVVYDVSWTGKDNLTAATISKEDISKLCSTLAFTDVHINLCSTMTIDGSAFAKPQIGPYYDDVNPAGADLLRNMYKQKHFAPVLRVNGLRLAASRQHLVDSINEALTHPDHFTTQCDNVLKEIITFTDGKSTNRVVEAIKQHLQANLQ